MSSFTLRCHIHLHYVVIATTRSPSFPQPNQFLCERLLGVSTRDSRKPYAANTRTGMCAAMWSGLGLRTTPAIITVRPVRAVAAAGVTRGRLSGAGHSQFQPPGGMLAHDACALACHCWCARNFAMHGQLRSSTIVFGGLLLRCAATVCLSCEEAARASASAFAGPITASTRLEKATPVAAISTAAQHTARPALLAQRRPIQSAARGTPKRTAPLPTLTLPNSSGSGGVRRADASYPWGGGLVIQRLS